MTVSQELAKIHSKELLQEYEERGLTTYQEDTLVGKSEISSQGFIGEQRLPNGAEIHKRTHVRDVLLGRRKQ